MAGVSLGDRVKDVISGQEGIVTGISDFLYGCRRVSVVPQETKDGKPVVAFWVDEPQLKVLEREAIAGDKPGRRKKKKKYTGGPRDDAQPREDAQR